MSKFALELNFYTLCGHSHIILSLFLTSPNPESDQHLEIPSEDFDTTDFHSEADIAPFPEVSDHYFVSRLTFLNCER